MHVLIMSGERCARFREQLGSSKCFEFESAFGRAADSSHSMVGFQSLITEGNTLQGSLPIAPHPTVVTVPVAPTSFNCVTLWKMSLATRPRRCCPQLLVAAQVSIPDDRHVC